MFGIQLKDVIAFSAILGSVIARLAGVASELDAIVALILGYYFSQRKKDTPTQSP